MTSSSVRPWLGVALAVLAFACGPQPSLEAGGLTLGFATRALDGPCPEQAQADPTPPSLTRLDYWLFLANGTLHRHGGGSIRAGVAPSFGGIPEGEHLRLVVVATAADGSYWAGGAEELSIQEGRATHADVFMSPSNDMACAARPLDRPRAFAASAALGDDQLLVAGGGTELRADSCGAGCVELFASRSAERYDPGVGGMLPAAPMHSARLLASATRLPDGAVLVVGGASRVRLRADSGFPFEIDPAELVPSFEVYLPAEDAWIEKPLPGDQGRVFHAATALPDGRVLVTGGGTSIAAALADAILFDPALESVGDFVQLSDGLDAPRLGHTSLVVGNQVLLLGGVTLTTKSPVESFSWTADGGTFSSVPVAGQPMNLFFHAAQVLPLRPDEVLLAGGAFFDGDEALLAPSANNALVYSASSANATQTDSLAVAHLRPALIPVGQDGLLLAGGFSDLAGTPTDSLELFAPLTSQFDVPVGPSGSVRLSVPRAGASAAPIAGGRALFVGGIGPDGLLGSAELFTPDARP
jgi:hypothetical protein